MNVEGAGMSQVPPPDPQSNAQNSDEAVVRLTMVIDGVSRRNNIVLEKIHTEQAPIPTSKGKMIVTNESSESSKPVLDHSKSRGEVPSVVPDGVQASTNSSEELGFLGESSRYEVEESDSFSFITPSRVSDTQMSSGEGVNMAVLDPIVSDAVGMKCMDTKKKK